MAAYADPDAQMGGAGPFVNPHGTPPAQQQQQQQQEQPQQLTDPELRLQENLQQLREGGDTYILAVHSSHSTSSWPRCQPWAHTSISRRRNDQHIPHSRWHMLS